VKAGIDAPIIPGILPVESWKGARKFALRCGTSVPAWLDEAYEKAIRDGREELLSISLATELCSDLIEGGVEDLHFYTLNRPHLTRTICHALGRQRQPCPLPLHCRRFACGARSPIPRDQGGFGHVIERPALCARGCARRPRAEARHAPDHATRPDQSPLFRSGSAPVRLPGSDRHEPAIAIAVETGCGHPGIGTHIMKQYIIPFREIARQGEILGQAIEAVAGPRRGVPSGESAAKRWSAPGAGRSPSWP